MLKALGMTRREENSSNENPKEDGHPNLSLKRAQNRIPIKIVAQVLKKYLIAESNSKMNMIPK